MHPMPFRTYTYNTHNNEPEGYCESCDEASKHYHAYRDAVSKKAAALRQLNNEMLKMTLESDMQITTLKQMELI